MRVELVDSSERFAALETEWRELATASSTVSPFLTWEWLNAWWTHLGKSQRLAIVTIRDRDSLVAIVPLHASAGHLSFFSRWEFLGTGCAGSDYLDAIVREGCEHDAMRAFSDFVQSRNVALHIGHLAPGSWLSTLSAPLTEAGWSLRTVQDGVCPFIRLAGHTWDSFLATIGPANRATTRRRLRLLDRKFVMRFEPVAGNEMRHLALSKLFDFHDARFGRQGTAFRTEALRAFHVDATERLSSSQLLRLYTLHLNGELAAVMYGISFRERFYFYQHGYDPRFRADGIGRALLDMSIRAAIEEGLREFDLLYGNESYKSAWTRDVRQLTRIDLFPPHLGGRLHQRALEAERAARAFARRVIAGHVPQTN